MSEGREAPREPTSGGESIARRAWPRGRQIKFAMLGSAVVIGSLLVLLLAGRLFAKQEAASASPLPPGTFRATAQQPKSMTLKPVELRGFASEEATDGKIAVNADRTTPLFSPYSGRVTRVMAKVGATVRSGEPLAIVDASEFLQAQSDLATAAAQAKIARISEE